jgi:hypothetical protein
MPQPSVPDPPDWSGSYADKLKTDLVIDSLDQAASALLVSH